ncbi:MAG: hypothetical protein OHK0019_14430 [Saprospiraceae bacterium]
MGWLVKWVFYFLLFLVVGVWIGLFGRLPSTNELKNIETANSTEIYTADSVLIGKFFIENRTAISYDNISPYIINALIATEDKRFLEHSGIDIQSWFRVGYGVLAGEGLGGGSTLSQQLAKNLYPRKKYWVPGVSLIINKLRENFISVRLERIYNKQELLNLYLNTVPFGGDVFGINVASRQYFNKKPKDLSVDQAATLVGMLKGTTLYNPVRNPNYSPFYSLRFRSQGVGIGAGASEVFEYMLPPQVQPAYINVLARFQSGQSYETHLNVFNCPVQQAVGNRADDDFATQISLSPNPVTDVLTATLPEAGAGNWQIFSSDGRAAGAGRWQASAHFTVPTAGLPSGIYYLHLSWDDSGRVEKGRFVKIK